LFLFQIRKTKTATLGDFGGGFLFAVARRAKETFFTERNLKSMMQIIDFSPMTNARGPTV
jgi:hypothetical protein